MAEKKILFVDDESNILDSFKRSFRSFKDKWDMNFESSSVKAFDSLGSNDYNIIIADYKMPEMDGLTLLLKVKEKYPGIKRILLTGQSEEEIFQKSKGIVDKYLPKPCDHDELIKVIENF